MIASVSKPLAVSAAAVGEDVARGEGEVLDGGAEGLGDEVAGEGAGVLGAVQRQAERAVGVLDRLAADDARGVDDVDGRRLRGAEDRGVEQQPGQHLVEGHGLGDVVDRDEAGVGDRHVVLGGDELGLPDPGERRALVDEVHHRAADAADRRDGELARAGALLEELGAEGGGALDGGGGVLDAQADVADADAVREVGRVGEALALGVDDEVDAALAVEGHVLRDVAAGLAEAHAVEEADERGRGLRGGGELDELDAGDGDAVGHRRDQRGGGGLLAADLVHQVDQRAVAVDRDRAGASRRGTGR